MPTTGSVSPGVRDRILGAAMELFYVDGINATGVDLIAARAGVSKRTLYKYFPSKVDLVEHYLRTLVDLRTDPWTLDISPREKLVTLFAVPEPDGGRMRGCPFHNAAVEAASEMPDVSAYVHEQKMAFAAAIVNLCRDLGGVDDPEMLGRQIALLYEGAAALSTSLDAVDPWACARATVEMLIDRAAPRQR